MRAIDYASMNTHKILFKILVMEARDWAVEWFRASDDGGLSQQRSQLIMNSINIIDLIENELTGETLATEAEIERVTNRFLVEFKQRLLERVSFSASDDRTAGKEEVNEIKKIIAELIEHEVNLHMPKLAEPKSVIKIGDIVWVLANKLAEDAVTNTNSTSNVLEIVLNACANVMDNYDSLVTLLISLKNILSIGDEVVAVH